MAKPTVLPQWATDGGAVVTEPSLGKKQSGWLSPEKPSDGIWNWLHNKTYQWLDWLDSQTDEDYLIGRRLTAGAGISLTDNGDNTQLIEVELASYFGKITTSTTVTAASLSGSTLTKAVLDCTDVSAGTVQLLIDGALEETLAAGAKTYRVFEASSTVQVKTNNAGVGINSATYIGTKNVGAQSTVPHGVGLSTDGTKMFVLHGASGTNSRVYQYTLSTPFLVSSATYDSVVYNVGTTVTAAKDIAFSSDGLKMIVLNETHVYEFTLASAWSIASVTYVDSFSLSSSGSVNSEGFAFSANGLKMYVLDTNDALVRQYDLSTGWDVSTSVYAAKSFSVSAQAGSTAGSALMVRADGIKFYVMNQSNDTLYQYSMTGGEITTGAYDSLSLAVGAQDTIPIGAWMRPDMLGFYTTGSNLSAVYQYSSGTAYAGTAFYHVENEV